MGDWGEDDPHQWWEGLMLVLCVFWLVVVAVEISQMQSTLAPPASTDERK